MTWYHPALAQRALDEGDRQISDLERNIRQMRAALVQIRDEAATKENGGAWAAGLAALCLATMQS